MRILWLKIWLSSLCLLQCLLPSCPLSYPLLTVRGSHYEVGFEIGQTFRMQIQEYISLHPLLRPVFYPFSKTARGQEIVAGYLTVFKERYPGYYEEMTGTAHGANVSLAEVVLINLRSELGAILRPGGAESCTDLLLNHPETKCLAIGHNEDSSPLIENRGYFVDAHIMADKKTEERFLAYCYPGELAGNAFSFNAAGLTFSVNALYPKRVLFNHTARSLLTRRMLAAQNMEELISSFEDRGMGAAYGFSANVGVLRKAGGKDTEIWNVEVAPDSERSQSEVDAYRLLAAGRNSSGNYFHVNMYRRLKEEQIPVHIVSSMHRTKRIQQMLKPKSVSQIHSILGDTADKDYPLYRRPRPTDNASTVATAIFDFERCVLSVCKDNPKTSVGPVQAFRLPC